MTYSHNRNGVAAPKERDFDLTIRDAQRQVALADICIVPHCPRCRTPLIARMTGVGPGFPCRCEEYCFD
jgi:hypothetical protein